MVIRLCARLSVILLSVLLVACPSKEGSVPEEAVASLTQEPAPFDPPVFKEIDLPYWGFLRTSNSQFDDDGSPVSNVRLYEERNDGTFDHALSLLSYHPELTVEEPLNYAGSNPDQIVVADTGLLVSLNTNDGPDREAEFTIFSRNDTLFSVNHETGEIRGLRHFATTVCEIIPADHVETLVDTDGDYQLRVINAPWVYVKTADGLCNGSDTDYSNASIQYYRLPINYKINADQFELCAGEVFGDIVGTNTNTESCKTRQFDVVLESEARARVLFGWVDDADTPAVGDFRLGFRYLGYGTAENKLRMYDESRELLWTQDRGIERFSVSSGDGQSPIYVAQLQALDNFNFLYQFGRDLFVFNSADLFSLDFNDVDDILTDRIYRLDEQLQGNTNISVISEAVVAFNEDDLLIFDQAKIVRYDYSGGDFTPNPATQLADYEVLYLNDVMPKPGFEEKPVFSQFDIQSCSNEGQGNDELTQAEIDALVDACVNAHDVNDTQLPSPGAPWQFVTECSDTFGCSVVTDTTDYCVTETELLINPSLADLDNPCVPSVASHFNELDTPANDAELIGFMQYASDHIRSMEFTLIDNTLFILARMKERDLLLRYLYEVPLSAAKSSREQVMLGARFEHQGIEAIFKEGNLFATLLRESATRANECYKNFQKVACDLADDQESGGLLACTALDLAEGSCVNEYKEYVSFPLYCSQSQIDAGACTEECTQQQIDDGDCAPGCSAADIASGACPASLVPVFHLLADESLAPFGKWVRVTDYVARAAGEDQMYMLAVDSSADVSDEGVIHDPDLLFYNDTSENLEARASLTGSVEHVVSGRTDSADVAWIDLIASDVVQIGSAAFSPVSEGLQVHIENPASSTPEVTTVSEYQFLRPQMTDQ